MDIYGPHVGGHVINGCGLNCTRAPGLVFIWYAQTNPALLKQNEVFQAPLATFWSSGSCKYISARLRALMHPHPRTHKLL